MGDKGDRAKEAFDRDRVVGEPRDQHLERDLALLRVLGAVDAGRSPFADVLDKAVARHAAA